MSEMTPLDPDRPSQRFRDRWAAYEWELIPPQPQSPVMNISLDQTLTQRVGQGVRAPTLRFWAWSRPAVILGRFQSVRNEVDEAAMRENGIDLVRRISGGGAMFVEPAGAITYSLYAPLEMVQGMTFAESYEFFDGWVIDALRDLDVDAWYAPLNDITSTGGKLGGAAQARKGNAVLHHTTMAYQMTATLLNTVLRVGKEKLSDKGIASADRRVGPLREQTELERDAIVQHMSEHFGGIVDLSPGKLLPEEITEAEREAEEKFSKTTWTHVIP